jgi:hypothetical protein
VNFLPGINHLPYIAGTAVTKAERIKILYSLFFRRTGLAQPVRRQCYELSNRHNPWWKERHCLRTRVFTLFLWPSSCRQRGLFSGAVKRMRRAADHRSLSSTIVKNAWSYTSTSPTSTYRGTSHSKVLPFTFFIFSYFSLLFHHFLIFSFSLLSFVFFPISIIKFKHFSPFCLSGYPCSTLSNDSG